MGIKLEYIIFIFIGLVLISFLLIEIEPKPLQEKSQTKEMAFTDTRFIEVDTDKIIGLAHSRYGEYEKKALTLEGITYHTDNVNLLQAQKGIYQGDDIYLEGNVTLNQKEGFDYTAQKAVYNKKSEVLNIDSPFKAFLRDNVITGESLVYDMKKKEAVGYNVKAVVYTLKK